MFEGTNLSEGRGTTRPFEIVGAPYVDYHWADALNASALPGARFRGTYFTPTFSKWVGQICGGVEVYVTDRAEFNAIHTALAMIVAAKPTADDITFTPGVRLHYGSAQDAGLVPRLADRLMAGDHPVVHGELDGARVLRMGGRRLEVLRYRVAQLVDVCAVGLIAFTAAHRSSFVSYESEQQTNRILAENAGAPVHAAAPDPQLGKQQPVPPRRGA